MWDYYESGHDKYDVCAEVEHKCVVGIVVRACEAQLVSTDSNAYI